MTKKKSDGGGIDPALVKAIDKLLKTVKLDVNGPDGKPLYTLTDVMKVIAAKTKIEAIRSKIADSGYGSGFGEDTEDE